MNKLMLMLLITIWISPSFAQTKVARLNHIKIHFLGKKMDKLNLVTTLDGNSKQSFSGHSVDGQLWEFAYPDSIYESVKYFNIDNKNDIDSSATTVTLSTVIQGDTLKCGSCYFSRGNVSINSSFSGISVEPKMLFKKNDGKIGSRTELEHLFLVNDIKDQELLASMEGMKYRYGFFYSREGSYEESLKKYVNITQKYPGSYGLLAALAARLNYYKSKGDIEKVYNVFSEKIKESYFGREIKRNLKMDRFDNMMLLPWKGDRPEPIVTDFNKYSLVIYSASWCAPCHKRIPLVRELQERLGDKLDTVYISIDEKSTVADWQKMMKNGEVPGRSLLALDQMDKVRTKYFVKAIPYSFLVYPGGNMEVVDVGQEERNKIYRLVGKK